MGIDQSSGKFSGSLKIELTNESSSGRPIYKVLEAFSYDVGGSGSGIFIDVPIGFHTDFASVPRFLWWIYPPSGEYGQASVIHDYMYRQRCKFSRILADAIFLDAMQSLNVPFWKRYTMYLGVRVFGWLSFNKEK